MCSRWVSIYQAIYDRGSLFRVILDHSIIPCYPDVLLCVAVLVVLALRLTVYTLRVRKDLKHLVISVHWCDTHHNIPFVWRHNTDDSQGRMFLVYLNLIVTVIQPARVWQHRHLVCHVVVPIILSLVFLIQARKFTPPGFPVCIVFRWVFLVCVMQVWPYMTLHMVLYLSHFLPIYVYALGGQFHNCHWTVCLKFIKWHIYCYIVWSIIYLSTAHHHRRALLPSVSASLVWYPLSLMIRTGVSILYLLVATASLP